MMDVVWGGLIFSILMLVYVYFIFPALMFFIKYTYKHEEVGVEKYYSINVVIPAHNEEKVIAQKLENHLSLKYSGDFVITVLCDSCNDDTVKIAKKYEAENFGVVKVFEVEGRKGKTTAINNLIPTLDSDVVVFSDANVMLDEQALENVNIALQKDGVGGVAGQLSYTNSSGEGAAASNGLYWKYEEMIKAGEAKYGSLMGADGSIFAIKTHLYRQLPSHVLDDFSTSMGIIAQGFVFKFDEKIKAFEKGAEENSEEFERKVRISNRSYNSYLALRKEIISTFSIIELVKFYSHKVLRWYSFIFMILALITSSILSFDSFFAFALLIFQVSFYLLAIAHHKKITSGPSIISKISNVIYYFSMANYASMLGIIRSIKGERVTVWNKAESTR